MLVSLAYEPFASRKLSPAEGGCKTLILSFGRLKGFVELIERRLSYPKIRDLCRGNLKTADWKENSQALDSSSNNG